MTITVEELKKEKHQYFLEWNTGDYYWDNPPDEEDFEGTLDELYEHIGNNRESDFEEKLAKGETVYDENEEIYSCKLVS